MSRRSLTAAIAVAALFGTGSALGDSSQSITATGTALVKVRPHNRHSNASISAAVERARAAGIPLAVQHARKRALAYARATGLTLGSLVSISDSTNGFYGPGLVGPFCSAGKSSPPFLGVPAAARKHKHARRCYVPPFASSTLSVTYAVGTAAFKSVTSTGVGEAPVRPKNRNSDASIRAAVLAAARAAIPRAINDAREYALLYAQAGGLTLGAPSSVSDAQNSFDPGFFGPFGPNRFCGMIQEPIFVGAGRHRHVKGFKRVHRCFVPRVEVTTLTVTYSAT